MTRLPRFRPSSDSCCRDMVHADELLRDPAPRTCSNWSAAKPRVQDIIGLLGPSRDLLLRSRRKRLAASGGERRAAQQRPEDL
jgi:hypothetical protein